MCVWLYDLQVFEQHMCAVLKEIKKFAGYLYLELEMAVSCCVDAANDTKVPGRVAIVLNCKDISPALPVLLLLMYLPCAYRMFSNNRKKRGKKFKYSHNTPTISLIEAGKHSRIPFGLGLYTHEPLH